MSKKILINGKGEELEGDVLEFVFFMGGGVLRLIGSSVPCLPESWPEGRIDD